MKRITSVISIVATSVLLSATPLLAAESTMEQGSMKDECLLISMNCTNSVDTIQQRIERLNKEIAKGTNVYTEDELRNLKSKLDDAVRDLDDLIRS